MAVLGRTLFASSERIDLPDLLSVDSFTVGDFKYLIKSLIGDTKPYVLRGFDIIDPANAIGDQNISIRVSDSVVFYPGSNSGPFYYGLPEGNATSVPLVPELRKNATNFVYLTFTTIDTAQDNRAFWDPDKNGVGGEFNQNVNTESVLSIQVGVSVASFPDNTIPVCKVKVGPSIIENIEDCRNMLFRLGSGGSAPDPFSTFAFRSDPNAAFARTEPPALMTTTIDPNAFVGGDKNIYTLKEWMDVTMTKIKELGGSRYWYEDAGLSLANIFTDGVASTFKSKGQWIHDAEVPGDIQWTEDILYKNIADPREIIIRASEKHLENNDVLYLKKVRDASINTGNVLVEWVNGALYVNGPAGGFENIKQGDWIRKSSDPAYRYLRVETFYSEESLGGSEGTAPALANSILLSSAYAGTTETQFGVYSKGVFDSTDILTGIRSDSDISDAAGEMVWLGFRTDVIVDIESIVTTTLSLDFSEGDGETAKVDCVGHGLEDGERITVVGSTEGYDGTYEVEVIDDDVFYIDTDVVIDEADVDGFFALVTTTERDNGYDLALESGNHSFESDDTIYIDGTGLDYDSETGYLITAKDATTFTIPVGSALGAAADGTAMLARINTRSELGMVKVVQGEAIAIGEATTANIRGFIGMNPGDLYPDYAVPGAMDVLDAQANYFSDPTDNMTDRVSRLTAMMADKAQDKTISIVPSGYDRISNTTNDLAQDIVLYSMIGETPQLDVILPGSFTNGIIPLVGTLSLPANTAAYVTIDRNDAFTVDFDDLWVTAITGVPLDENVFVIAYRLTGGEVWLWDGSCLLPDEVAVTALEQQRISRQDRTMALVNGGLWSRSGNVLAWDDTANIQIAGLADADNAIDPGNVTLTAADAVAYVIVNRITGGIALPPVVATAGTVPADDDCFILARKSGTDIIIASTISLEDGETKKVRADADREKIVRLYAQGLTTPPGAGDPSVDIDGIAVVDDDLVLVGGDGESFKVFKASGVGASIVWTPVRLFKNYSLTGGFGESVRIIDGGTYSNQLIVMKTDTTQAVGSSPIRQFATDMSVTDKYTEFQPRTATILDDDTTDGIVFAQDTDSGTPHNFRNFVIEFSVTRDDTSELGHIYLISDAVSAAVSVNSVTLGGSNGITFTADMSGTSVRLLYTTTNTGFDGEMTYIMRKWQ